MSYPQDVGPARLREGSALTPRQSWPGHTQGSSVGLALPLASPPHRLLDALSSGRRGLSRLLGWYKFHRPGVRHSVRGSSNPALKRPAARSGVPLCMSLAAA
jgi:hypothetical protein